MTRRHRRARHRAALLSFCAALAAPAVDRDAVLRAVPTAEAGKTDHRGGRSSSPKAKVASADAAQAERLLDRGVSLLAERDLVAARQSLEQSLRLQPQPILLYYLGAVAVADGRVLDAHDLMRRYLADPGLAEGKSDERTAAEGVLAQPLPAHGSLQILGDAGVLVSIDGHLVGTLPLSRPLLLSLGTHRVALEAGAHRVEEQVEIAQGRPAEIQHHAASNSLTLRTARSLLLIDHYSGALGEAQPRLGQALDRVLASEHYSVQRREAALETARDPSLRGCLDTLPCQRSLGRAMGSDLLLQVQVAPAVRPTELALTLTVYRVEVHEPVGTTEVACPLPCSTDLAHQLIQARLPELLSQAQSRPRGQLSLTSQPLGAEVFLRRSNGWERLGLTPLEQVLWAGRYEVQLRHAGRSHVERSLNIESGTPLQLTVELPREVGPSGELIWVRRPRPPWRIGLAAGLGAVGLGLGIAGISALSLNGQCVGSTTSTVPGAQCLSLYATGGIGAGLLTAGLLTLAGAALTVAIPEPLRPQLKPSAPDTAPPSEPGRPTK